MLVSCSSATWAAVMVGVGCGFSGGRSGDWSDVGKGVERSGGGGIVGELHLII